MRATEFLCAAALAASPALAQDEASPSTLVIAPATQKGYFGIGDDIGSMNPHQYRPNEFVTNAIMFEGLTQWDASSYGADGVLGTSDDFIVGSLAESWTSNIDAVRDSSTTDNYYIRFNLVQGTTFHDGEPWNADAAVVNFDHILGGSTKSWGGFHDWYGLASAIQSWRAVSEYEFEVSPACWGFVGHVGVGLTSNSYSLKDVG
jgi:ABC-type transport system substrate-binding protein